MKTRAKRLLALAAVACVSGFGALAAGADPLITMSILGKGPLDSSFSSSLTGLHIGDVVQYQLVLDIAPVGTVNGSTTITSLVSGVDGINSIPFIILSQPSTDALQVNFSAGGTIQNGFSGGTGTSGGAPVARGATAYFDLNGIRLAQGAGTFVAIDPTITLTGSFTVAAGTGTALLGGDLYSSSGTGRINNNTKPIVMGVTSDASGGIFGWNKLSLSLEGGVTPPTNKSVVTADPADVDLGTVLYGSIATGSFQLHNTGDDATDTNAVTLTATGAGLSVAPTATTLLAKTSAGPVVTLNTALGQSGSVAVVNTTANLQTPDVTDNITVHVAVQDRYTPVPVGQTISGSVKQGNYPSLETKSGGAKGTSFKILGGVHEGTDLTLVSETWSNAPTSPNFGVGVGLGPNPEIISDVLDLTGTAPDTIVIQLSYVDSGWASAALEQASADQGHIQIVSPNGVGEWVPTITLNVPPGAVLPSGGNLGPWAGQIGLSQWGVDTDNNLVWAVVDHNSQFAAVPEPATFGLLGISALGLLMRRRRA
jgi:hypothetical protein